MIGQEIAYRNPALRDPAVDGPPRPDRLGAHPAPGQGPPPLVGQVRPVVVLDDQVVALQPGDVAPVRAERGDGEQPRALDHLLELLGGPDLLRRLDRPDQAVLQALLGLRQLGLAPGRADRQPGDAGDAGQQAQVVAAEPGRVRRRHRQQPERLVPDVHPGHGPGRDAARRGPLGPGGQQVGHRQDARPPVVEDLERGGRQPEPRQARVRVDAGGRVAIGRQHRLGAGRHPDQERPPGGSAAVGRQRARGGPDGLLRDPALVERAADEVGRAEQHVHLVLAGAPGPGGARHRHPGHRRHQSDHDQVAAGLGRLEPAEADAQRLDGEHHRQHRDERSRAQRPARDQHREQHERPRAERVVRQDEVGAERHRGQHDQQEGPRKLRRAVRGGLRARQPAQPGRRRPVVSDLSDHGSHEASLLSSHGSLPIEAQRGGIAPSSTVMAGARLSLAQPRRISG